MAKKESGEGLGISGFTLGIMSIIMAGWLGLILSIVGFSFCMVQQKKHKTKLGKAGMVIGVIGFIPLAIGIALLVTYFVQKNQ